MMVYGFDALLIDLCKGLNLYEGKNNEHNDESQKITSYG